MTEGPILPTNLRRFRLSDADLLAIGRRSRPRLLSLADQRTPQELANAAWEEIGNRMGFDWTTVEPDPTTRDKGCILAVPLQPGRSYK